MLEGSSYGEAGGRKPRGGRRRTSAVDDEDANNAAYVPSEEEPEDEDEEQDDYTASVKKRCGHLLWQRTCLPQPIGAHQPDDMVHCVTVLCCATARQTCLASFVLAPSL